MFKENCPNLEKNVLSCPKGMLMSNVLVPFICLNLWLKTQSLAQPWKTLQSL